MYRKVFTMKPGNPPFFLLFLSLLLNLFFIFDRITGITYKEVACEDAAASFSTDAFPLSEATAATDTTDKKYYKGEEGWTSILERKPSKTRNTWYDPSRDAALFKHRNRYARSPVPKGSWSVRVAPNRVLTMDEVVFAYDIWFEENSVFGLLSWMGVQMQQDPSDAFAIQDMLWRVKPDLIIEIGTNSGGGAIFFATIMKGYNPRGKIVTLDVKPLSNWMGKHADRCVGCTLGNAHPWWNDGMIQFIQGKITDAKIRAQIDRYAANASTVLVIEDASHRYPNTLNNMEAAHQYVTPGSYLLVQDTKMDRFAAKTGKKKSMKLFGPMRSVNEFIAKHKNFVIDRQFEYLMYSQHHRGFLRKKS